MNHIRPSIEQMRKYIARLIRGCNNDASDAAIMHKAETITHEIVQKFAHESIYHPKRKKKLSDDELNEWLEGMLSSVLPTLCTY